MEEDPFFDSIAHNKRVDQAEAERRQTMIREQLVRLVELANMCGEEYRDRLHGQLDYQLEQQPFDPEKVMRTHYTQYS